MDIVTVSPVRNRAQRKAFVECEYALHRADACWVPPLRRDRYRLLSRTRNPFLSFGEVALYLARRGGKVVGRIAAVHDPRFNRHHGTRDGFFGLFACVDDPDVARRLFQAAGSWLIGRNMTSMVGPVNFSTNYECGALVDGFDLPAALLMPWNPPFTPVLIESCGFTAVQDLHAWEWACVPEQPEALGRVAAAAVRRGDITVRTVDVLDYAAEMRRIRDLYHRAWQDNWGFVPMTGREFQHLADQLRPALRPELALVAEVAGEPAGFSLTLPDLAPAFRAAGGRLHRWGVPTGLARMLRASRQVRRGRLMALGVVEEFRNSGVLPVLLAETERAARRLGYEAVEISWVLDSNKPALRSLRAAGCRRTKTYRIYRRELRHGSYEQALRNH
ncbi:GNAT family N-acetyltransferase [Streptomyces sp. Wb2n-11]|uniref:GNAT family N-acetyltransferase n=1 Tax=Streptomyces sp. Wb2n-11 TaxID=1030533 RepID=UPI001C4011A3|nr:GNAT family N-acetyltransferase [Streptomyces sp. Wb2n-11]